VCVCDKIDWMENGWMENGLSGCGCGKWMDVESGAVPDLTQSW